MPITVAFIICTLTVLSPLSSTQVYAASPYDSGYSHGYDDAQLFDPSEHYINQPGKGPEFHTDEFMDGYHAGYAAYEASTTGNPKYDCSEGSDGCDGLIYCDINDKGSCYDRYD